MEFDSLSAYTSTAASIPASTQNTVRMQPRNQEFQGDPANQAEGTPDIPIQDQYTESGNAEKLAGRERNEQSSQESALAKAIESANKKLGGTNYGFQYSVHEKTKLVMIKVVNSETHETVREVPPQKHLDAIARMWELAGILVDEKR